MFVEFDNNIVFLYTMSNINKKVGLDFGLDETVLNVMVTLFSILNACSRLIIGTLADYVSVKGILAVLIVINVKYCLHSLLFLVQFT